MTDNLPALESQLTSLKPTLAELLPPQLPPDRLLRTIMVSLQNDKTGKLAQCSHPSIMQAAITAAVLGLEVDGVSGQGYLIPFGGVCQFVTGYKGFNTLGARAGYTLDAAVVREGDDFNFILGTSPKLSHIPKNPKGRVVYAWATALHATRPPIIRVLHMDDIAAVKAKSPGARKTDSPWNDPSIGFPAMAEKTSRRRLARSMPLSAMTWAAVIDEAVEERGLPAHATKDGVVIDGEATVVEPLGSGKKLDAPPPATTTASGHVYRVDLSDGSNREFANAQEWAGFMKQGLSKLDKPGKLEAFWKRNAEHVGDAKEVNQAAADLAGHLEADYQRRLKALQPSDEPQY